MNDENNIPGPNLDPLHTDEHLPTDPGPAGPGSTDPGPAGPSVPVVETTATDPPGGAPPSKPSWKTWVAVAVSAAVVGAAAVFGISAATSSDSPGAAASTQSNGSGAVQTPDGGTGQLPEGQVGPGGGFASRPGGFGTIATIDGSTLTIEDQSGETTKVLTTSDTEVTQASSGSVDDIKVGDTVMVVGTGSSSEIEATRVTDDGKDSADGNRGDGGERGFVAGDGPPGGGGQLPEGQRPDGAANMATTRGVVKSVGDGTFTVTGAEGTVVTVKTSASTEVSITKTAKVSDLEVGDTVMVLGDESDGTITATSIREGVVGGPMGRRIGGPPGANPDGAPSDTSDGATQ